jgi:hypothetical protein
MERFENFIVQNKIARYIFFGLLILGSIGNVMLAMAVMLSVSN